VISDGLKASGGLMHKLTNTSSMSIERRIAILGLVVARAVAASQPVTRLGGIGAECDSVFARLFGMPRGRQEGTALRF
jgi:hypothetical protein